MKSGGRSSESLKSNFISSREIIKSFKDNNLYTNWLLIIFRFPLKLMQYILQIMTIKFQNKLINFSTILFVLIPISLISGPLIPDLSLVIIIINFILLAYVNKKYEIFKSKFLLLFLLFCLIIIIVSFFSLNTSSIQSSLFYFRFGLFALAAYVLIEEKKNLLNYTLYLLLFIYLILFIDSIYQYKFGQNLLVTRQALLCLIIHGKL